MTAPNVVIVESPAKAKTINKYLGSEYVVIASYGHVRDLVNKDGSVLPDEDFAMRWLIGDRSKKNVSDIKKLVKAADTVYLATDPDREGEAISWHINEILEDGKLLKGKEVHRVAFNEITKNAVQEAFTHARKLDQDLIDAYMARRALDYLVGFNISPILWRKLPGSRSAGRVQSVALRLICEREAEIEAFNPQEYWSLENLLHSKDGAPFTARLTTLSGNKLGKLDIGSETESNKAATRIKAKDLKISKIVKKQARRNPYPPFITSSLQMEGSRKLGLSAAQTMRCAQQLYEAGLITYMRTDGTTLSQDAVSQARGLIKKDYGDKYLPDAPRLYKSKAKNAQEAHEAIRPTDLSKLPAKITAEHDAKRLYDLIWKRTMASQMENAILDQVAVDISDGTDDVVLRANGSVIAFDGFLTLYIEEKDEDEEESAADDKDRILPPLSEGDNIKLMEVRENQHFTQPPPRYTEASLVKRMEELGIGRPSTYASVLQVLRDRQYVIMDRKRFVPEDRGRLVTSFLKKFFAKYMDYDFTANLEEELDAIAAGLTPWKEALRQFWIDFSKNVEDVKPLTITEVIDYLNEELGIHFFPERADGSPRRECPACKKGELSLKLGKFGAFIGCSDYPECKFTRPLVSGGEDDGANLMNEPKELGKCPDTGRGVSLRRGPYGAYVQIDAPPETKEEADLYDEKVAAYETRYAKRVETAKKKGKDIPEKKLPKRPVKKPKRQGLPAGVGVDDVTLESALSLLSLPRDIGEHPESGKMMKAGIGRFGPFVVHDGKFASIPKDEDVMTIGMNRAVDLIAKKAERDVLKAQKQAEKGTAKKTAAKKKPAAKKKAAKKTAKKSVKKATKKTASKKSAKKS
jgi:DNA topoisomerase-1